MLELKYLIMHDIPVLLHSLSVITRGFFIHLGEHTLFPFVWECLRAVTAPRRWPQLRSSGMCCHSFQRAQIPQENPATGTKMSSITWAFLPVGGPELCWGQQVKQLGKENFCYPGHQFPIPGWIGEPGGCGIWGHGLEMALALLGSI